MTVLTIRAHKRYAVRQPVRLAKPDDEPAGGLMIELSSEGCRISNLGRRDYEIGEPVTVQVDDIALKGRIRWAHDGLAGVRLDRALFGHQLTDLISRGRGEDQAQLAIYGT
jgi:hypothetical protein